MKAFVLLPLFPIEIVRIIQQFYAIDAVNTIIRSYYRKVIVKVRLTQYFCSIEKNMLLYGHYRISKLPTFLNNIKIGSRILSPYDDLEYWWTVYINIQKTLSIEEYMINKSILGDTSYELLDTYSNDLRFSLGGNIFYTRCVNVI